VYLRGSAVVVSVKATGACGCVEAYLLLSEATGQQHSDGHRTGGWDGREGRDGMWPTAIGGVVRLPHCGADRSVVDVPTHPTFVECDDLKEGPSQN